MALSQAEVAAQGGRLLQADDGVPRSEQKGPCRRSRL